MKQDKFSNMTKKVEQWLNLISQRRPCLQVGRLLCCVHSFRLKTTWGLSSILLALPLGAIITPIWKRPVVSIHHTTGRAADIWIQNKSLNKNKNSEVAGHNCLSSKGDTRPVCGVQNRLPLCGVPNWFITMNGIYFCPKPLTPLYSLQSSRGKITLNGSRILYFHNTSTPPFVQHHWYITTGTPISSAPPLVHHYLVINHCGQLLVNLHSLVPHHWYTTI